MEDPNRFDSLIEHAAKQHFPEFYLHQIPIHLLFKAQVWAESSFNPNAVSKCGARGLMQLMPGTAREMGLDTHEISDPEKNISAGIHYDRIQYGHLSEIPDRDERLKFMLASYNCGRGYVNVALRLARAAEFGFVPLACVAGKWQTWKFSSPRLADPECMVNGRKPDFVQVWEYVSVIWQQYEQFKSRVNK